MKKLRDTPEGRLILRRIHDARKKAHWGSKYDTAHDAWPQTDADWRKVDHGAPFDTNVLMAEWHAAFAPIVMAWLDNPAPDVQ